MSDAGEDNGETTDYSKMKVNDLKKLLKNKGLPFNGNKQELVERLQSSEAPSEDLLDGSDGEDVLEDGDLEKELDESCLMGDDTIIDKPEDKTVKKDKNEEKEVPLVTSPVSEIVSEAEAEVKVEDKPENGTPDEEDKSTNGVQLKRKISLKSDSTVGTEVDKKKLRAERFMGVTQTDVLANKRAERLTSDASSTDLSDKAKKKICINSDSTILTEADRKKLRGERFGAAAATTNAAATTAAAKVVPHEALKKRAERFGILSPAEMKKQQLEKLQARKLRFGANSATTTVTAKATLEPAASVPIAPVTLTDGMKPTELSAEERKKLRAQRFKLAN